MRASFLQGVCIMELGSIGVIGLAVMGANLARNLARNHIKTVVFNRTAGKTEQFMQSYAIEGPLTPVFSLNELVEKLEKPRKIIIMVKAGDPVDAMISQLIPLLDKGDIIIDGGNSFFEDTIRRSKLLSGQGLEYVGMGVSGGEEGALNGPSLMPGCSAETYAYLEEILQKIAAKAGEEACVAHIGTDGAGHYVKMVHNGIEYADMQLIADTYSIMKQVLNMDNEEIAAVFAEWNKVELSSYLIEITSQILKKKDKLTDKMIVDVILDVAKQKGTGKWTSLSALELGVPIPTITEAVFARNMSCQKEERVQLAKVFPKEKLGMERIAKQNKALLIDKLRKALYAAKVCAYTQGFNLIATASKEYNWDLNLASIARIWRNGCIIRATFLDDVSDGFNEDKQQTNLLFSKVFNKALIESRKGWGEIVSLAAEAGVPVIALSSALNYYDSYRTAQGNANILQAQRDYFGAHTYERVDRQGSYHTEWSNDGQ